jgi:hypothetical protein
LNGVGFQAETAWGTNPKPPSGGVPFVLAQATVKDGVAAGTTLGFFCSQHGQVMNGSLAVGAAGGAPTTITIDGEIVNGTPTWVFNSQQAVNVAVKPGDTVIWRAAAGTHGVVFIPSAGGVGLAMAFSNDQLVPSQNPQTPIFRAAAGSPVRFRLVMPSTSTSNGRVPPVVFDIQGHGWPEEPFADEGEVIGGWRENPFALGVRTPAMNWRSQYLGSQQIAVYEAFNFVIDHAGGGSGVAGDYLYEAFQQSSATGMWGLFRVKDDLVVVTGVKVEGGKVTVMGRHEAASGNQGKPFTITVASDKGASGAATIDGMKWTFSADQHPGDDETFTITSSLGGTTTVTVPKSAGVAMDHMKSPPPAAKTQATP